MNMTGLGDFTLIMHSENMIRVSKPADKINLGNTGRSSPIPEFRQNKAIEALLHMPIWVWLGRISLAGCMEQRTNRPK